MRGKPGFRGLPFLKKHPFPCHAGRGESRAITKLRVQELERRLQPARQHHLPLRLASRRLLFPAHYLKLGKYFGNEPEYWMRLQNHYLFRKTQRKKAEELDAIIPLPVAS